MLGARVPRPDDGKIHQNAQICVSSCAAHRADRLDKLKETSRQTFRRKLVMKERAPGIGPESSLPSSEVPAAENNGDASEGHSKELDGKFRDWLEATKQHGPLMTRDVAAAALAVSRQRVHQLISKGQLASVPVGEYRYVPLAALEAFRARRRSGGRPRIRS